VQNAFGDEYLRYGWRTDPEGRQMFALGNDLNSENLSDKFIDGPLIQLSASILFMFQSTANLDSSRKAIVHASLKDIWVSILQDFSLGNKSNYETIVTPFACEFRAVKALDRMDERERQEYALDSDSINISIGWENLTHLMDVATSFKKMYLKFGETSTQPITYPEIDSHESRTAKKISVEFQPWTVSILDSSPSCAIRRPLFTFEGSCKCNGSGFTKELRGEITVESRAYFYSNMIDDLILFVEPMHLTVSFNYDSNKLVSEIYPILIARHFDVFTEIAYLNL
jgi:hypothetical protein